MSDKSTTSYYQNQEFQKWYDKRVGPILSQAEMQKQIEELQDSTIKKLVEKRDRVSDATITFPEPNRNYSVIDGGVIFKEEEIKSGDVLTKSPSPFGRAVPKRAEPKNRIIGDWQYKQGMCSECGTAHSFQPLEFGFVCRCCNLVKNPLAARFAGESLMDRRYDVERIEFGYIFCFDGTYENQFRKIVNGCFYTVPTVITTPRDLAYNAITGLFYGDENWIRSLGTEMIDPDSTRVCMARNMVSPRFLLVHQSHPYNQLKSNNNSLMLTKYKEVFRNSNNDLFVKQMNNGIDYTEFELTDPFADE